MKVLGGDFRGGGNVCLFSLWKFSPTFSLQRVSASGGFPFSRLQELIEILDFGPKRREKPKEAGLAIERQIQPDLNSKWLVNGLVI